MIPNQWYAVLESKEAPTEGAIGVTRLGEKLVFWRDSQGKLSCLRDQCPHRGAALSIGKVLGDNIQCPFHGFEYDKSGKCVLVPAIGKNAPPPRALQTKAYIVREAMDFIWLWYGEPREDLPEIPVFSDLDESFSYLSLKERWPVHYTRAIENQLDVVHLPFVHRTTIGRGNRTVIDGPIIELKDNMLRVWVFNRKDDGIPARKPQEIDVSGRSAFLHFRFPNIWMNRISDDSRIVVAFVPIDDSNTLMYLRPYQRMVKAPVVRRLVDLSLLLSSRVILRQDRRVVLTQRPIETWLRMGEKVIQGDRPIVAYRAERERLKALAGVERRDNASQGEEIPNVESEVNRLSNDYSQ